MNKVVLTQSFLRLLGDACIPNPCQNGGSCIFEEQTGTFRCNCPPGYTGRTCDISKLINRHNYYEYYIYIYE